MNEPEQGSGSELISQPELTGSSNIGFDEPLSSNDINFDTESPRGSDANLAAAAETDASLVAAERDADLDAGLAASLDAEANARLDTDLDAGLEASLAADAEANARLDADLEASIAASLATKAEADANLAAEADADLNAGLAASLATPPVETNSSTQKSITIEITKDKLDELLTKISEETINYLSLLIKFLEKKTQLDTNDEKINKTIQELTQIKDNAIKILTENEITSNSFDPASSAQKSQYAEMIMAALGIAAVVTGGKRLKSKKREKKHKKTKNLENKNHNHKTKKQRRKKGKTKGQMIKINNDPVNKENN